MKLLALVLVAAGCAAAQSNSAAVAAREWRETHERAIVEEFMGLLSVPNLARDAADVRRNAEAISTLLTRRGMKTRLLEISGVPPAVYGEILTPGATRTIVF